MRHLRLLVGVLLPSGFDSRPERANEWNEEDQRREGCGELFVVSPHVLLHAIPRRSEHPGPEFFPRSIRTFPQRRRLGHQVITRRRLTGAGEANRVPLRIAQEKIQGCRITGIEEIATASMERDEVTPRDT